MSPSTEALNISATTSVLDVGSLTELKRQAKAGDPAANKAVAKQFEALFLQMVLKSMRAATPREGLFDSQQSRMFESLLDQQLSQTLGSGNRGTGLAALIEAQLGRQHQEPQDINGPLPLQRAPSEFPLQRERALPLRQGQAPGAIPAQGIPLRPSNPVSREPGSAAAGQRAFVDRLLPAAVAAEQATGIPAHFMVAQAALETGWGKSEPTAADGRPSFNLFGIKAGAGWHGPVVEAKTTEVIGGLAQARTERFRAYSSHEEAFRDYANLLAGNPRYAALRGAQEPAHFARGLQAAGYATDPHYAAKLERIIGSAPLRQAMLG